MAMKLDSTWDHREGIKVEGDLGDILVAEESSDSENDQISQTPNSSNTLSTIPASLVHTATAPVFGNVSVSDSENVQLGNNTYFNGPVTIKQIIQNKAGVANASYISNDDETRSEVPTHSKNGDTTSGPQIISPEYLRIVSRADWLAQPSEGPLDPIRQPAPWVIITHTATENCYSQSECVLRVRIMQTYHIESKGWYDIGYNFLVGGDGSIYYGRGWDYIGAHTQGYNKYSIGIAFIGTFNTSQPPNRQIEACEKLIRLGLKLGKIAKDYKLFGHRQLMSTLSPGDALYNIIKTWPNFVSNFTSVNDLLPNY